MPPGLELPWRRVRPLLPQAVSRLAAATTAPKPTTPFATFSSRFAPADRLRCVATVAKPTIKRVRWNHSAANAPPAELWPAGLAPGGEDGREDGRKDEKQKEEKTEADGQQRSNAEQKDVAVDIDGPGSGQRIDHQQQEGRQQRRSPGAVLLESLARDPVRRPADDRASSPSALVAPLVHYPHPLETQRSRLRHRKSVVRQARLEAIRQALERPLPDWREILQRLVAYTPYYGVEELLHFRSLSAGAGAGAGAGAASPSLSTASASTPRPLSSPSDPLTIPPLLGFASPSAAGHRDTVSYILPENSPSVDELLRGTDNSLWAIRNRTGSDLELYRRGPMSSKDSIGSAPAREDGMHTDVAAADDLDSVSQTARPWLLTLSGPEASVNHAVADVLRFAKDAVAVAADSNARWGPARIRAAEDGEQSSRSSSPAAVLGATAPAPAPTETSAGFSKQEQTLSAGTEDHEPALAHYTWNLISTSYSSDAVHEGDAVDKRDDVVYRPYTLYHNAYEIPQPAEWTRDSFERYVAALTNSRPALHLAGDLYRRRNGENNKHGEGEGEENADADHNYRLPDSSHSTERRSGHYPPSHDRTVIELLHRVFNDEATRHALSTSALNRALAFMGQRGEAHRPDVRALFVRMELLGLPMDTTTFNTMLASLVKTQDLRNFGATLLLMHGRGHAPDLDTWLLFLRLFESETVKRHILHAMHARGLLTSPAAVQRVAWEMARHDAERAVLAEMEDDQSEAPTVAPGTATAAAAAATGLDDNKTTSAASDGGADATFLDRFLDRQTARYGDGWLTARTANRILDIFGRYSRFDDCERLLGIMQQQEQGHQEKNEPHELHEVQPPAVVSFNIVLTHCKVQKALSRAVAVVKRMQRPGTADVTPDFVTYQLLFDLAWQCRLPRVLGVVWHCASAARQTSHWMRKRAGRALAGPGSASTKFLVQALQAGDRFFDEPAGWANDGARRAAAATKTTTTAGQHLGNVVSTRLAARYAGWEPAAPLGDLLQEARDRDLAWLQRRKYGDSGDGGDDNGRTRRPRSQPMRIPLRRRADKAGGPTGDGDDPASNRHMYMNIVVDEMVLRPPPAAERQTEADDGSGIAAAANE
ncbi:hypothetical protein SPI_00253 [Niveomyces insectorum RCEF 264]|uniref:Pentatricopeptide repeat protein n=1 Tax=Niveomyces insectorum RCEF 264 TaxID=1081102 RepID=A0A167ZZ43_9HYPO|nr:hypothetical protein SPI_00253 [Niveomyces insectorum RCEF 264]